MRLFFAIKGDSLKERGFRFIGMILVLTVVIWAFWKNNENMIEKIHNNQSYWDETGKAPHQLKGFAKDFASALDNEFGIRARVHVRRGVIDEPEMEEGELYLAVSPSKRQVMLRLLPLDEKGAQLVRDIENEHFSDLWEDQWGAALETTLVVIWKYYSGETTGFMDSVASATDITDETGLLTPEDLKFISRFAAGLEKEFGQKAVVRVFTGVVIVPELDSRTMFLGISPALEEVLVSLPPLIHRSLPPGFVEELNTNHFQPYFASGDWPLGLKTALIKIWKALAGEDIQ